MTDRTEQKGIARILDNAAARADSVGAVPATSKQCWFLASLIMQSGQRHDLTDTSLVLTKRAASEKIDDLLTYINARKAA